MVHASRSVFALRTGQCLTSGATLELVAETGSVCEVANGAKFTVALLQTSRTPIAHLALFLTVESHKPGRTLAQAREPVADSVVVTYGAVLGAIGTPESFGAGIRANFALRKPFFHLLFRIQFEAEELTVKPTVQLQPPSSGRQSPPFWQGHVSLQPAPVVPEGHTDEQIESYRREQIQNSNVSTPMQSCDAHLVAHFAGTQSAGRVAHICLAFVAQAVELTVFSMFPLRTAVCAKLALEPRLARAGSVHRFAVCLILTLTNLLAISSIQVGGTGCKKRAAINILRKDGCRS